MSKPIQFEQSIQALEQVVSALEKGDASLDDALKQFEKGIGLTRACQTLLTDAEQKINQLINQDTTKGES
ncbi:MAG: exodeoxyribonuclease VII small subunit [Gammaproteobacteria bacterium]|nr:exodeoxyribonuclease VII small subunit [Gammaproteobacteria bacterium]MCH9716864.1 exodeoxyribonuclease VII small subunit [Gammaproteobacteria bacterium]MCH9763662.1 exodeoxyribonuclease VII small subunit [Gammaproteobacteria bacterium]